MTSLLRRISFRGWQTCLLGLTFIAVTANVFGAEPVKKDIAFGEGLVIPPAGRGGRVPIPVDPINALMASGAWQRPKAGDKLPLPSGKSLTWSKLAAKKDGSYESSSLNGGRAFFLISSDQDRVMVLEASGHTTVWVNGEPRVGDPYSHGYVHVPVELKKGENEFLFTVGRGELRAKLTPSPSDLFFNTGDTTLPDLIVGTSYDGWGAVPIINATPNWQAGLAVTTTLPGASPKQSQLPALPPLSISKVPFQIAGHPAATGETTARLELHRAGGNDALAKTEIRLRVLKPEQTHKCTFRSRIDGSVQYYALVPASAANPTPGLTLTLHGAGVEGFGQAACFKPKPGRTSSRRQIDGSTALTGKTGADSTRWKCSTRPRARSKSIRSACGSPAIRWAATAHGIWASRIPDKFAGIGPSAGWISMMSYAGVPRTGARRCARPTFLARRVTQRYLGPRQEPFIARRVHPARRSGRQCARRASPRNAQSARRLSRRLGLSRTHRCRPLVGQPVRRLAADVRVLRRALAAARRGRQRGRLCHGQPQRLAAVSLGGYRAATKGVQTQFGPFDARCRQAALRGNERKRGLPRSRRESPETR